MSPPRSELSPGGMEKMPTAPSTQPGGPLILEPFPFTIHAVRAPEDLAAAVALIKTYTAGLGIDLSYQDFESEMARMPGSYAPPFGELLIATKNNESHHQNDKSPPQALGCIALRALHLHTTHCGHTDANLSGQGRAAHAAPSSQPDLVGHADGDVSVRTNGGKPDTNYCELKRLYVTPAARGLGVGKALVKAALDVARKIGYEEVRLDTLPDMRGAIAMYRGMGFGLVGKYYEKAIEGTVFLGLRL